MTKAEREALLMEKLAEKKAMRRAAPAQNISPGWMRSVGDPWLVRW